jgi:hypothetical protein
MYIMGNKKPALVAGFVAASILSMLPRFSRPEAQQPYMSGRTEVLTPVPQFITLPYVVIRPWNNLIYLHLYSPVC